MRIAYSIILIISLLVMQGCSYLSLTDQKATHSLPRLMDNKSMQIIQVAAHFDDAIVHDHPYFITCSGDDCPTLTPKTPIELLKARISNPVFEKGRTVEGVNTTYLKKVGVPLDQFRVHFDYASEVVTDFYHQLLKRFVNEYEHDLQTIRITGFTDSGSKPTGTIGNEWLALERATSVKRDLVSLGYPESHILLEAKFLCCYLDSNKTKAGRHKNRRAEITLIKQQK